MRAIGLVGILGGCRGPRRRGKGGLLHASAHWGCLIAGRRLGGLDLSFCLGLLRWLFEVVGVGGGRSEIKIAGWGDSGMNMICRQWDITSQVYQFHSHFLQSHVYIP